VSDFLLVFLGGYIEREPVISVVFYYVALSDNISIKLAFLRNSG
jgi:hypothetical protein